MADKRHVPVQDIEEQEELEFQTWLLEEIDESAGSARKSRSRSRRPIVDPEEEPLWKSILETVVYFAVVLALGLLIIKYVGQRTEVVGESMMHTLEDGDQLVVEKFTYRFRDPQRFDIIVFPFKQQEKTYFVKRIIGLPGETVQIKDGLIYINGEVLEEHYGIEPITVMGLAEEPVTLGADEYFVMGDNRNNSRDSRDPAVGNLKRSDLIGRAVLRLYPFSRFGTLKDK